MLPSSRRLFTPSTLRICTQCLSKRTRSISTRSISMPSHQSIRHLLSPRANAYTSLRAFSSTFPRPASHTSADELIERLEHLYSDAKDEFEMAAEETEGNTVYAADDRAEASRLVTELKVFYDGVTGGESAYEESIKEEVKKRAGTRVREIVNAMAALEEQAMHQD